MKTLHKIALAKLTYRVVHFCRGLLRLTDRGIAERNGVKFDLDLSQGIDFAIYLQGHFEPSTAQALARNTPRGATVVDIGANIGAHTLHLARHVGESGRVLAFEPTALAFAKLQRNIALNPDLAPRISAHHCFLGPVDGGTLPSEISSTWPLTKSEGLHSKHFGQLERTSDASSRSLDSVLAEIGDPVISLVKLDVDGFECEVLSGARRTMQRCKPVFVMELAPYCLEEHGTSLGQLLSFFLPLGYRFYNERTEHELPTDAARLSGLIADGESMNVIARP